MNNPIKDVDALMAVAGNGTGDTAVAPMMNQLGANGAFAVAGA